MMDLWHTKGFKWKILLAVLLFLAALVLLGVFCLRMHQGELDARREKAQLNANTYANYLIEDFSQAIGVTESMEQIVISGNGRCNRFEEVAQNLFTPALQSIQIAPNGVVTDIYPALGNEAGKIDLIHDEKRGEICRYGRDNNIITLQGPFSLKQGGSGIAVRNPVYLEDADGNETFWGFTIVILRVPEVFARSTLALERFGYDYRLLKSNAPLSSDYDEIASSRQEITDPASYTFTLDGTNSTWKLEVMPKDGWHKADTALAIFCTGSVILVLMLILALALIGMREQKNVFRHLATTDPLTGLLNRKGFDEALNAYLTTTPQAQCVGILLDIDNFKSINDVYGHATGDLALRQLAESMHAHFPANSILGRNGGDEFSLILKDCTCRSAAERIRAFTEERRTFWQEGKEHAFTISVGYAELSADDADRTPALLLSEADLALYEVKLRGKRSCLAYHKDLRPHDRTHLGFALQDISQHLPGAFLIYKADRTNDELLFANQEMVRFAGCTDLEDFLAFTDRRFRNLIHPDERETVEQSIWAQQNAHWDGSNDYVSFRLRTKGGAFRPVLDHGRLVHNRYYGNVFYVMLMDSDFIQEHYEKHA